MAAANQQQSSLWSCYEGYDPFSGLPVPGGLSEMLWADCQQQALEALHHPFLAALAAGTMDRPCFQHYIAQDAFFLNHFAQTYAAALDKCRARPHYSYHRQQHQQHQQQQQASTDLDNAKAVLLQLLLGVHVELRMHGAYAAKWGVRLQEGLKPSAATSAYTDFLMSVAHDPEASVAEVLAAMVPCSRLYGFLGCRLAAATSSPSPSPSPPSPSPGRARHTYSEWLDTYSSIEYLVSPIMKEMLFDELGKDVPYERLKNLYSRAMQLEVNFFSAQPNMPAPRDIKLLVVDFDDTCTEKDTIGVLLNAAVEANARAAGPAAADSTRQQLSSRIKRLSDNYIQQQQQLVQQLLQPAEQQQQQHQQRASPAAAAAAASGSSSSSSSSNNSGSSGGGDESLGAVTCHPGQQYNAAGLQQFCEALSDFDRDMNQVVIDDGCLKGLTAADLAAAGSTIQLRSGCAATLGAAAAAGIPVAVLSVNWSKTLMEAALAAAAAAGGGGGGETTNYRQQQPQQQPQQQYEIFANEMEWSDANNSSSSSSTGGLQRQVENGRDKARVMQHLLQQHVPMRGGGGGAAAAAAGAVVYVGDSASDILPLLQADFGIIIGQNKLLRRTLAAFGVQLKPLCSAPLTPPSSGSSSSSGQQQQQPVLYEAGSWQEIAAFLFGPSSYDQDGEGTYPGMVHVPTGRGASAVAAAAAAAAAAPAAAAAAAAGVRGRAAGPPLVLTIAGSDSGGGAGIQADIKTIMANGGFGMSAITALTAQNSSGVQCIHTPPPDFLMQQLDSVLSDLPPAAMKTGMLPNAAAVSAVAAKLREFMTTSSSRHCLLNQDDDSDDEDTTTDNTNNQQQQQQQQQRWLKLVVDPVMISTSGHSLAGGGVGDALRRDLVPLAAIITPNLTEAEALCGDGRTIGSIQDMKAAAAHLHKLGCAAVLIKGGHLAEKQQQHLQSAAAAAAAAADGSGDVQAVDVLYDGQKYYFFTAPYISTTNTHGTGCTLAAAIASGLAHGQTLVEAVQSAKDYLTSVLASSAGLALGAGPQHPFHHGSGYSRTSATAAAAVGAAGAAAAATQGLLLPSPGLSSSPGVAAAESGALNPSSGGSGGGLNPVDLRMYVVTDPHCNAKAGRTLFEAVKAAVAGGATIVQIREKDLDGGDFLEEARAVIRLCRPLGVPVIINDRVDVALAAGADGVHIGQSDLPARLVRHMIGPHRVLGVSVKTPAEAAKAQADGADYIGVGAVFPTGTKVSSVVGLEGLRTCVAVSGLPAVAIGGVGISNAREVIQAGVQGLAVVSAVFAAADVEAATRALREAVDDALRQQQQQEEEDVQEAVAAAV